MDYHTYKLIHLIGLCILFFSLGSLFTKYNKGAVMGHGIGLLILFVAGFGMQAKGGIDGFPLWLIAKIVIWLAFGAAIVLAKRNVITGKVAWISMIALGSLAAYLGVFGRLHF